MNPHEKKAKTIKQTPTSYFHLPIKKRCQRSFKSDYPQRYAIKQNARFLVFDELIRRQIWPNQEAQKKSWPSRAR